MSNTATRVVSLAAIGVVIAGSLSAGVVSAQSVNRTQELNQTRCERIQAAAPSGDRVQEMTQQRTQIFTKAEQMLTKYIDSSKKAHYGTEGLEAARESVKEAREKFTTASQNYQDKLTAIQEVDCIEKSDGANEPLKNARNALQATREASQSSRTVIQEEAVPALRDYATWVQAIKSSGEGE